MKRAFLYAAAGGVLIALLKFLEYKHFVRAYPTEVYGGLVAVIFTAAGLYFGLRWKEHPRAVTQPFVPSETIADLGITPREHEVLQLIAAGLTNRQIGEKLFVSENTVKTHSSRLFDKLDVRSRTQAVRKGKDLGLIA